MFKKNGGFTLVELIVVIAILAILAGVAVPAYSGYIKKSQAAGDQVALSAVKTAVMVANATTGTVTSITFTEGVGVTDVVVDGATAVTDKAIIDDFYGSDMSKLTLDTGNSASWSSSTGKWTIE